MVEQEKGQKNPWIDRWAAYPGLPPPAIRDSHGPANQLPFFAPVIIVS
jgi:hypothetical protein